jgi:hypothetical protein
MLLLTPRPPIDGAGQRTTGKGTIFSRAESRLTVEEQRFSGAKSPPKP